MEEHLKSLDQVKASAIDMAMRFGPKFLVAALIMVAGYLTARWAGLVTGRLLGRFNLEAPIRSLLQRIVQFVVLGLFAILAMQNLGVELLPLVAGLGVAGAGVALALQGLLGNIVAGLTIIFVEPFHLGDYISIGAEEGEVIDISLFSTTLGHFDRSRVVIPNRKIVGEILHNCGQIRRLNLSVSVAYATKVEFALEVIREVLAANARVLATPPAVVGVFALGESGVILRVAPWVKGADYEVAASEVNLAILEAFRQHEIVIPFPQQDVRLVGGHA